MKGGEKTDKNLEMKVDVDVTRKAITLIGQKKNTDKGNDKSVFVLFS